MTDVLKLSNTEPYDPRIDAWLDKQSGDLGIVARELVRIIRHLAVGGTETMHDGSPVTCIDGAPFVYVAMFKDHLNVGFFQGAHLPDPNGLLQGTGKSMRHVKLTVRDGVDAAAVVELVQAAYDDMSLRASATAGVA